MTDNTPVRSRTTEMQIAKTTYIVTSTFNENARESVEQKLLRFIAERVRAEMNASKTA